MLDRCVAAAAVLLALGCSCRASKEDNRQVAPSRDSSAQETSIADASGPDARGASGEWQDLTAGIARPEVRALAVDPTHGGIVYLGTFVSLFKTTDGGRSWNEIHRGLPRHQGVMALAVDRNAPGTVYAGTQDGLWKSTDGGGTWTLALRGVNVRGGAIAIDPTNSRSIYVGTEGGTRLAPSGGVIKSTDAGLTWQAGAIRILDEQLFAGDLVIDPHAPHRACLAASSNGVLKTTDGGETWTPASDELDEHRVWSLAFDPAGTSTLYAGTGIGVLKSTDEGASSIDVTDKGMRNYLAVALVTDPAGREMVFAGTNGRGVWQTTDAGATWSRLGGDSELGKGFISALALDAVDGVLYAGTGRGVFRWEPL